MTIFYDVEYNRMFIVDLNNILKSKTFKDKRYEWDDEGEGWGISWRNQNAIEICSF